jgi:hypothetical protein
VYCFNFYCPKFPICQIFNFSLEWHKSLICHVNHLLCILCLNFLFLHKLLLYSKRIQLK